MKLFKKNLVCPRCIVSVEQIPNNNNLETSYIHLGEVELLKASGPKQLLQF